MLVLWERDVASNNEHLRQSPLDDFHAEALKAHPFVVPCSNGESYLVVRKKGYFSNEMKVSGYMSK